jgi:hypothetical protein
MTHGLSKGYSEALFIYIYMDSFGLLSGFGKLLWNDEVDYDIS